ncbi:hypothetical protein [Lyngbya sp. PCC 8106]|uniref:hypothetical protein n=1 Tax=Lyngbya sp. (strain PCC 8106) TaxID=313612 RepID=UPI0000EAC5E3|nr:hypothetical protein [Lyngbya sp. PCC 8106]EAW38583.1 hypothetical protein L8106_07269 [Lyngbya sp. PCC 8106]
MTFGLFVSHRRSAILASHGTEIEAENSADNIRFDRVLNPRTASNGLTVHFLYQMGLAVFTGILEEVTKVNCFLGVCGAVNSVKSLKINTYSCMWCTQTASH